MRIKLDENLPERLIPPLRGLGHDVDTVLQEGLRGQDDDVLWPQVQKAERLLITKDLGFCDERKYPPGTHRSIIALRLLDDRSLAVAERLAAAFGTESVDAWSGCIVIVTDNKVRVRRG